MRAALRMAERAFDAVEDFVFAIALICTAAIALVTVVEVVLRYLFSHVFIWSFPAIAYFMMPLALLFALSACEKADDHITIVVASSLFSRSVAFVARMIALTTSAAVSFMIAGYGMLPVLEAMAADDRISSYDWYAWPHYAIVPVAFFVLGLRLLLKLLMLVFGMLPDTPSEADRAEAI